MIFPRMSALSEVLWSPKEKRDWPDFERRVPGIMKRYELWKANYSNAYYDPKVSVSPSPTHDGVLLKVSSKLKNAQFYFGNKTKNAFSKIPDSIVSPIKEPGTYGIRMLGKPLAKGTGEKWGNTQLPPYTYLFESDVIFQFNKATGKKITIETPPAAAYPGSGAFTLVDGIQNEKGLGRSSEILGFNRQRP